VSKANVEVVRQALAVLDQRDVEAYLKLASPQIELVNPATPLEGPINGHEGIRRFFSELWTFSDASEFRVEEIRAVEGRVLAFFVLTTRGRMSEAETSVDLVGVYDLEDGKIRRAQIFLDRADALEAVGLPE
jgi:ketosteroid isomerase-like protein